MLLLVATALGASYYAWVDTFAPRPGEVETSEREAFLRSALVQAEATADWQHPDLLAAAAASLQPEERCRDALGQTRGVYAKLLFRSPGDRACAGGTALWGAEVMRSLDAAARRERVVAWLLSRPDSGWAGKDARARASWDQLLRGQVTAETLMAEARARLTPEEQARLWVLLVGTSTTLAARPDETFLREARATLGAIGPADPRAFVTLMAYGVAEAMLAEGDPECYSTLAALVNKRPLEAGDPGAAARACLGSTPKEVVVADWDAPPSEALRAAWGGDPVVLSEPVTASAAMWVAANIAWTLLAPVRGGEADPEGHFAALPGRLATALTLPPPPPAPAVQEVAERFEVGRLSVTGPVDGARVEAAITRILPQLRYCYARERVKDPSLHGEVTIGFTIGSDGMPGEARVLRTTLADPAAATCMAGRFARLIYPTPRDGGVASVEWTVALGGVAGAKEGAGQ